VATFAPEEVSRSEQTKCDLWADELAASAEQSREIMQRFHDGDKAERRQIASWFAPVAWKLALSPHSTRLCQEVLVEVVGEAQTTFLKELEPHFEELYQNMHGNYVLARVIEVMPSAVLGPLIRRRMKGRAVAMARHRFGCRIVERVVEHCSEAQIGCLLDEIVADAGTLCRHPFGNFVVQKILEHGSIARRTIILKQMVPTIPVVAMHRTASHVVQKALDHCGEEGQCAVAEAILRAPAPNSVLEIADNRFGSFVLEQLASCGGGDAEFSVMEVRRRVLRSSDTLVYSQHGRRVLAACGLELPDP
jgi:hypothetical protein